MVFTVKTLTVDLGAFNRGAAARLKKRSTQGLDDHVSVSKNEHTMS